MMGCSSTTSCTNDYQIFDYPQSQWRTVETLGNKPPPREGQSVVVVGYRVFMMFGVNNGRYFNDVYTLDLRTQQWRMHYVQGCWVQPRANQRAVLASQARIFIFGGYTEEDKYSNEMFIFYYLQFRFEKVNYNTNIHKHNLNILMLNQQIQEAHNQKLLKLQQEQLLQEQQQQNNQNQNNQNKTKEQSEEKEQKVFVQNQFEQFMDYVEGRELFVMFLYKDKIFIVFGFLLGGVTNDLIIYDIRLNYFYSQKQWGNIPLARQSAGYTVIYDRLYIVGGCDYSAQICYNDCYILDLTSFYWQKLEDTLVSYSARQDAIVFSYKQYLVLLNGCGMYEECFSDLHLMNSNWVCNRDNCGEHSKGCIDNTCVCKNPYVGTSCAVEVECQGGCSGQGICTSAALCNCYGGYYGDSCQYLYTCPNNCTSSLQGICLQTGCSCSVGYTGPDCATQVAKQQQFKQGCQLQDEFYCGNKGKCQREGHCLCQKGYFGSRCQHTNFNIKKVVDYLYPVEKLTHILDTFSDSSYDEEYIEPYNPLPQKQEPKAKPPPKESKKQSSSPPPPPVVQEVKVEEQPKQKEEEPAPKLPPPPKMQEPRKRDTVKEVRVKVLEPIEIIGKRKPRDNFLKYEAKPLERIEVTNMTELEHNKEHKLVPEFFGLASDEDIGLLVYKQLTLKQNKQPTQNEQLAMCDNKCNFNGICVQGQCYCRNGFYGQQCEYFNGMLFDNNYTLTQVFWMAFLAYVCGLIAGLIIMVLGKKNLKEYGDIR